MNAGKPENLERSMPGGMEKSMGKYFGTDGFRGEANVGLKVEDAFKVGRFLGLHPGLPRLM